MQENCRLARLISSNFLFRRPHSRLTRMPKSFPFYTPNAAYRTKDQRLERGLHDRSTHPPRKGDELRSDRATSQSAAVRTGGRLGDATMSRRPALASCCERIGRMLHRSPTGSPAGPSTRPIGGRRRALPPRQHPRPFSIPLVTQKTTGHELDVSGGSML